ncbi:biopolymer transporter ExbD [Sphingomonas oleivorans]|uniref:Biopolymer transporter ExbD n=1 Tax=Sphingomonas oleivorans TaxID=1735121 RepID=A0A2T5G1H2_9SPHN|nr:biopolymer transporter ExbD [Sphingomonas oleivorans]PTQ12999.1 biopolymer transporter ExbD [Sphingomonas oleivorans]
MAMSAGPAEDGSPMSDINTTPLVDVMLVLLIIFLITVPVVIQTVPVNLPKTVFEPTTSKPENVVLSIRNGAGGDCEVYWGQTRVSSEELLERAVAKLKLEIDKQGGPNAAGLELPETHIRGDVNTNYRCIGGAVFTMQRAGFARVGFISEPAAGTATAPRL